MKEIGIIGVEAVARAFSMHALAHGFEIVLANSRGPETLKTVIAELDREHRPDLWMKSSRRRLFFWQRPGLEKPRNQKSRIWA